jgi:hypothetical protein
MAFGRAWPSRLTGAPGRGAWNDSLWRLQALERSARLRVSLMRFTVFAAVAALALLLVGVVGALA